MALQTRISLKLKLSLFLFLLNLSGILLVGAISYNTTRAALFDLLENNISVMSRQTAENVDRFISDCMGNTEAIALHYALFNLKTTTSNQNTVLASYNNIYHQFEHINIINIEDVRIPTDKPEPWYIKAFKGMTVSSDIYISPVTDKPTMSFAAPVKDRSGNIVSIITTNLDMEQLWDITDKVGRENRQEGLSGYAFLVRSDGFIIAHPKRAKIMDENPLHDPDQRLRETIADMIAGKSGISSYYYEGVEKHAAYAPCKGFENYPGHGWSVGITYPDEELFGPLNHLVRKLLIIFVGTTAMLLLLSALLANYLAVPILALREGASRIGGGDFDMRIPVSSNDELGDLASSFNDMAETLQARERQIIEYTASLTEINVELHKSQDELKHTNEVLVATNEELVKLEKQKAEFTAMLSHDIKSPLSTIITYTDMVTGGIIPMGSENMTLAVNNINSSAQKILTLVDNFLVSSTLDAGRLRLNLAEMDVNQFVDDEVQFLSPRLQKKKLALEVVHATDLPAIMADKVQMDRVFTNIVSNAIKYTNAGGRIRVVTGLEDSGIFISVSDTGVGVRPEDIDGLFDMYKRSDNSSKVRGFGLGLYISRALVEAHGGSISVESKPGEGTTFRIALPARLSSKADRAGQ